MSSRFPSALLMKAPYEGSYSTQPQDQPSTVIERVPATQYLTLNSADRFQSSSTQNTQVNIVNRATGQYQKSSATLNSVNQNWNNFILQRPQNLMESFATRISVSEVRFPWFIPNISSANNTFWVQTPANAPGQPLAVYKIVVPGGFYTASQLATTLGTLVASATAVYPPAIVGATMYRPFNVAYTGTQFSFIPIVGGAGPFSLYYFDPFTNPTPPAQNTFYTSANLLKTLGFTYNQSSGGTNTTTTLIGSPTNLLYTDYVDIVSEKINYYSETKDGSSTSSTNNALICRLYLADEVSMYQATPVGQAPFLIHRQFKNPKQIMWNKEAVIDLVDIKVLDQYGQLVPLPVIAGVQSSSPIETVGSYPDFQITLLASEN
jgi:hypothetical protein